MKKSTETLKQFMQHLRDQYVRDDHDCADWSTQTTGAFLVGYLLAHADQVTRLEQSEHKEVSFKLFAQLKNSAKLIVQFVPSLNGFGIEYIFPNRPRLILIASTETDPGQLEDWFTICDQITHEAQH